MHGIEDVEVDQGRIAHDGGIVATRKHIAGPAHIGGKLINFVKRAIENPANERWIAQVALMELASLARSVARERLIRSNHAFALRSQPPDQMVADKPAPTADQDAFAHAGRLMPVHRLGNRKVLDDKMPIDHRLARAAFG